MATGFESFHDGVVSFNSVLVFAGLERCVQDGVSVAVVSNHDVLVAAAGADREPAGVVGVELFDGLHTDVDFARGGGEGVGGGDGVGGNGLGWVERTPWRDCDMWPLMVSSERGQYLAALV